ncbi:MAG: type IV pilin assembly protein PilC [Candidatus Parcubacteria bacterium]|nr:MAG: type IV pilin assembly protein PilC [Candidatus Parcubacteria bacterium]
MKFYYFEAFDPNGKIHKGKILGESEIEISNYLKSYNLSLIKIKEKKEIKIFISLFKFLTVINLKDKILLYRNLALILKSGASLIQGLKILTHSIKYSSLKEFLMFLIYYIEKGGHIYEAFEYYKNSFNPIEIEIIKIGEISGNLVNSFEKLSEDLTKEKQIKSEIISMLIYPMIILIITFLVIIIITTFVIPRLANLVNQMETELPFYSKIILDAGIFIGNNIKLILLILLLSIIFLFFLITSKLGRQFILKISFKIPIIKNILLTLNLRTLCFILESLLKSGISLSKAIGLTTYVINHPEIKEALIRVNKRIEQGYNFNESINQEIVFPKFFVGILGIASETGKIIEVLEILQNYYEEEFKFSVKNLTTLIEPALIIFVGLVVGLLAVSIVIPIYQQISSQIEKGFQQRPGGGL